LPCLIKRHDQLGHLCGYVGVPAGHPWHGLHYDAVGNGPKPDDYDEEWWIDVHGGLTYANGCTGHDPATSICHVPNDGEPDDVWWLGFDCAHAGDLSGMAYSSELRAKLDKIYAETFAKFPGYPRDEYRDVAYVTDQCALLAKQAAANA
jgi:hypothetical protein